MLAEKDSHVWADQQAARGTHACWPSNGIRKSLVCYSANQKLLPLHNALETEEWMRTSM